MSYDTGHLPRFPIDFLKQLSSAQAAFVTPGSHDDAFPAYRSDDASDRALLATHCRPESFQLGTGASIFTECLIPAMVSARSEIILVTCFWAPSKTLTALRDALAALATHRHTLVQAALARSDAAASAIPPLNVRICLSSRSLIQKLLHPQTRSGYVYPPSAWEKQLGLPGQGMLEAGRIQLHVKSLFFLPFSLMHPKFVIIDGQRAFVPSCNVSWEPWLEACVELTGDAVRSLLSFYTRTWGEAGDPRQPAGSTVVEDAALDARLANLTSITSTAHRRFDFRYKTSLPALVLPSSHHRNPRFRPFPWQRTAAPPSTPLNVAVLQLLGHARQHIYIQTPNITCEPVIAALLDALARGVRVTIVTNRNLMLLEQLLTAGTTTSWCIRSLIRRFHRLEAASADVEAGRPAVGRLQISYFRARAQSHPAQRERGPWMRDPPRDEEPVHSHLKLTLVDGTYTVLGSANMDRASWYTSQELSLLFHSRDFCETVRAGIERVLEGRLNLVFDSDGDGL